MPYPAALVFVMTPGVGLFYSGLVRSKNALTLIFVCLLVPLQDRAYFQASAVVSIQWVLFGFSLTFSETGGPYIGNFDYGGFGSGLVLA